MLVELWRQVKGWNAGPGRRLRGLPARALAGFARPGAHAPKSGFDARAAIERLDRRAAPPAIVVPIHNAPDALARCLASLIKHTRSEARIILIDDASSDPRVGEVLALHAGFPQIEIHRNDSNLGFTQTANRGIAIAGRADVVLLNSDTDVTPRWLENLRLAAHCGDRVGTATPFSDNAGAFSAPEPDRANPQPDWLSRDAFARLVTQATKRRYPEVPTGHGFCMYIRRDCLDEIGLFDAKAFPRGYGEENDFCRRAAASGWSHVVDDATFIFHARAASFGAERAELLRQGRGVLNARYPDYARLVRGFARDPALSKARADIAASLARSRESGGPVLPRALFVIATQVGGTPQTNQDLMAALADRYETYVLHCDAERLTLMWFRAGASETLRQIRLPAPLQPFPHVDKAYDRIVAGWLTEFAIEIVHIRHLVWHSLSLPRLARTLGIPVIFSFHDFYAICPTVRLVDENDVFCGGDCTASPGQCQQALWTTKDFPPLKNAAVHDWRKAQAAMLAACDAFVTTSADTRDRIRRFFPITTEKPFPLIEHGRDFPAFDRLGRFPETGESVRVLVPGNISTTKGARVLKRLAELDRQRRFAFHVLGKPARELKGTPGIVLHGVYDRARFGDIVRAIDPHLGAILSIWPETFCHTLTEMWAAGLPVAAFDLGAVGERIRAHGGGWLAGAVTPEAAFELLGAIAADRAGFERNLAEVAAWQNGPGTTESCAWMADRYHDLYRGLLEHDDGAAERDSARGLLNRQT